MSPPHIIAGTPGRILALVKQKHLDLSNLQILVIDECDKVLEATGMYSRVLYIYYILFILLLLLPVIFQGYIFFFIIDMRGDVQQIYKNTPHQKQVMMFSATLPQEMKDVCKKFMKNPFEIYIDNQSKLTLHGLKQYYVKLEDNQKIRKLTDLLDSLMFNQVIIFVKSVLFAIKLDEVLRKDNFPSVAVHSDLPQEERIKRYNDFKKFNFRIMVATDVFGRGIDIEKINVVFNFDMPKEPESYLHRVGRAGRFGTKGLAITFVSG